MQLAMLQQSLERREEKTRKRGASVVPKTATLRILVVLPVPTAPLVLFQTIHRILWIVTTVPAPTKASARLGLLPLTSEP